MLNNHLPPPEPNIYDILMAVAERIADETEAERQKLIRLRVAEQRGDIVCLN